MGLRPNLPTTSACPERGRGATDPADAWSDSWADLWFDTGAGRALADQRKDIDQTVLANLLRLNQERAGKT